MRKRRKSPGGLQLAHKQVFNSPLSKEASESNMKITTKHFSLIVLAAFTLNIHAEVSYMTRVVSDFVFEGISQTDSNPALQGYVEYADESGFYLHTWGSNVDYGEELDGVEIDLYFGYEVELNDKLILDTGYVNYFYVADDNNLQEYEYSEVYANLTYQENTTFYAWAAKDDAVGGQSFRFKIAHTIPLENDYHLNIAYHRWRTEEAIWDTDLDEENGRKSYNNFLIGLSKEFNGFLVDLSYSDTDIKSWKEAKSQFTLSISRTFE